MTLYNPQTPPDVTRPQPGWRKTNIDGKTAYLPTGLAWDKSLRSWKINLNGARTNRRHFKDAWELYCQYRADPVAAKNSRKERSPSQPPLIPHTSGVQSTGRRRPTGVDGLTVSLLHPGTPRCSLRVVVSQRLPDGSLAKRNVAATPLVRLDQEGLDDLLVVGTAMIRTYERRYDNNELTEPVTVDDYDIDLLPDEPVQRIWLTDLLTDAGLV